MSDVLDIEREILDVGQPIDPDIDDFTVFDPAGPCLSGCGSDEGPNPRYSPSVAAILRPETEGKA